MQSLQPSPVSTYPGWCFLLLLGPGFSPEQTEVQFVPASRLCRGLWVLQLLGFILDLKR